MKDINIIKEKYATMSDNELLQLFTEEKESITKTALDVLINEITKRGISPENQYDFHSTVISSIKINDLSSDLIHFITDSKEKKNNDEQIIEGLRDRGLEEKEIMTILEQIPEYAETMILKANNDLFKGFTMLITGLSITFLPLSKESHKLIYILAYTLILLGTLKLIHGINNKTRFTKIKKTL